MHIDVIHQDFNIWQINPFGIIVIFSILIILSIYIYQKRLFYKYKKLLILFLTFFSLITIFLELYYFNLCPVDNNRYKMTKHIFLKNVETLNKMNEKYTVSDGTILAILRNSEIPIWDQDSDILIEKPIEIYKWINTFKKIIGNEYSVEYKPKSNLIQIKKDLAHGDIWLYKKINNELINYHRTISQPVLNYDMIFPSKNIVWLNKYNISVPNKSEIYAELVFGKNYMKPYYNRFQCIENVVTLKIDKFLLLFLMCFIILILCLLYKLN